MRAFPETVEQAVEAVRLRPTSETASFFLFHALCSERRYIEALDETKRFLAVGHSDEYAALVADLEQTMKETDRVGMDN